MTVALRTTVQDFVGLAADAKPTAAPGSSFYETDTGLAYVRGDAAWHLVGRREP